MQAANRSGSNPEHLSLAAACRRLTAQLAGLQLSSCAFSLLLPAYANQTTLDMRLLKLTNNRLELTWFPSSNIPPYAILSHTWGRGEDEVTFKNIPDDTGQAKRGFEKLLFCGRQAREHDLEYFWVDTCCIDKSSSSELTESINSMFRWYQQAERCYVYLADVSVQSAEGQLPHGEWESAFRNSHWFTRGWTLQELLAPRQVEFYSREGARLGDKISLLSAIHDVTGINREALHGGTLDRFSIEERLSWIDGRETSRPEDRAYSLLGIYDVYMPLIYSEGEENAFRRLRREIAQLAGQTPRDEVHAVSVMPFERNPHFVGREDELVQLQSLLFKRNRTTRAAVVGLGGMGKTQVAIELVHRTMAQHKDRSVFWLVATDRESLLQSYRAVAEKFVIPGRDKKSADLVGLVQAHLSLASSGPWLLVYDNADDMQMWTGEVGHGHGPGHERRLLDCLPKNPRGSILFTTRNRKVAVKLSQQDIVEIGELQSETSLELLQKHLAGVDLSTSPGASGALLEVLTNLPLAVVQAAAYINANGITVTDYLQLFKAQDETAIELLSEDFEDEGRYRSIKNPIATTWLISFERIRQDDPLAADYLSFMACVEPKDIPVALIPGHASPKQHLDAIGTLRAYSFVTRRLTRQSLDVHRLIHLATRNWLSEHDLLRTWTKRTMVHLGDLFPSDDHANRPT